MVDRDVVRQPRAPERCGQCLAGGTEGVAKERGGGLQRLERPEAVEDADTKTRGQERAAPPTPRSVFRPLAEQAGDVVAAVVVDDEEPPLVAQDPVRLTELGRIHAAKGGPQADDDIDGLVWKISPKRHGGPGVPEARPQVAEPGGDSRAAPVNERDVAPGHRPKRLEAAKDLSLDIECGRQPAGKIGTKRDRQVRHGDGSIGPPVQPELAVPRPVSKSRVRREGSSRAHRFGHNPGVLAYVRRMPGPIRLFLGYALILLVGIGLSLRYVIDLAISAPVSLPGVVVMVLLAYTIFTITLVLQRKEAARTLALGLSSLTIPVIPWAIVIGQPIVAIFFTALAILLIRGLRRGDVAAFLSEP